MRVLELFSGSQSVSKVCDKLGYECVSLDITDYNGTLKPTHLIDIMLFDYKQYDKFDIVWASPPCVNYSSLQQSWYGRHRKEYGIFTKEKHEELMKHSDILVAKTLEIIDYFKPSIWVIENPQSGRLKTREVMNGLKGYEVSYCMYTDWGYKKPTRLWTNKEFVPKKCEGKCGSMDGNKHKVNIAKIHDYLEKCRVPSSLIIDLIS